MSLQDRRDGTQIDCDLCGEQSPFFDNWEEAVKWSQANGWKYDSKTKENYCPECQGN